MAAVQNCPHRETTKTRPAFSWFYYSLQSTSDNAIPSPYCLLQTDPPTAWGMWLQLRTKKQIKKHEPHLQDLGRRGNVCKQSMQAGRLKTQRGSPRTNQEGPCLHSGCKSNVSQPEVKAEFIEEREREREIQTERLGDLERKGA